ncbi:glutamyl aminopeptidase [Pezoporus wallicus]|uniref:glutamyl aminopeptidase n=1 Tax=Pezoporus wallicus TaxID=35540 RepID=UPI00254EDB95|nr:glutamyl aminopeptidase [Pezoporus wallicus]XP_061334622.1 glutamyl aminopeptidase [Pezoporus flaviventris]
MEGMHFEDEKTKRYCMKTKHVAIICGVVVIVGLAVGLGVGLSRPKSQQHSGETDQPTNPPPSADLSPCPSRNDETGDWTNFRLPTYVKPIHYDLEMKPEMETDTYTGTVSISIALEKSTSYLWLHLRETKITEMPTLQKSSGQQIAVNDCFGYEPQEYIVMKAETELSVTDESDPYILTLKFQGWLNGSLVGFYRTTYTENGLIKSIAATDHEPTDARKSFPCFDEPNKKATYNISIIHQDTYQALSNMPVQQTVQLGNNWNRTTFEKSVPMSTYLVCFAVHQFQWIEKTSASGKPLRVYAQPLQIHTAEYAANVTKTVFDFFEEYFNVSYSLPKLDKIAIPDFGTGAMENWGLITYRETNLLYDPNESATSNKQRVAAVIAHELVHQWFGNIVTMDWWDDLWLNEGFASYFEFLGVNAAEPDWQMLEQVLIDDVLPVMMDDSLQSSHPIVVDVSSTAEITSVFDGISYSKGASILRMLQDLMTPDLFQKGCQIYLKKHHFQNAKTDQFWEALEEASDIPVKEVMDTWTRQMGYPVLEMGTNSVFTQKRFLLDPNADASYPPSDLGYKWNIPVKWRLGSSTNYTFYNLSDSAGIAIPSPPNSFVNINPDHIGFYRVNYNSHNWASLSTLLASNHKNFSAADRAGILDDVFSLARSGLVNYSVPLELTKYLINETDYLPWHRLISSVTYLTNMLGDDTNLYPRFQEYFRHLVKPVVDQLHWNDVGGHLERLLRTSVLDFACSMGDTESLNNASQLFDQWLQGQIIPANLRLLVYRYGMQNSGNETSWNYMFEKYQETTLAQEKEKLLYGLASVKNITLLDRYLKYIYNTSLIKSQDAFTVLRYISYNTYGKTMTWDWIRLNWEYLVDRFTINDRYLGRIVTITQTFHTELQLWQMENFFEKYPNAGAGESPRSQSIEQVKNNIEWLKVNKEEIQMWLEEQLGP